MIQVKKLYKCQKAVIIKKEREKENSHDVNFSLNKNDMMEAMQVLSFVGFKLYMYCASNMEGYVFGLSKVDVMANTKIGDGSYSKAVNDLIDNGYLVYTTQQAIDSTGITAPLYEFRAKPLAKSAQQIIYKAKFA